MKTRMLTIRGWPRWTTDTTLVTHPCLQKYGVRRKTRGTGEEEGRVVLSKTTVGDVACPLPPALQQDLEAWRSKIVTHFQTVLSELVSEVVTEVRLVAGVDEDGTVREDECLRLIALTASNEKCGLDTGVPTVGATKEGEEASTTTERGEGGEGEKEEGEGEEGEGEEGEKEEGEKEEGEGEGKSRVMVANSTTSPPCTPQWLRDASFKASSFASAPPSSSHVFTRLYARDERDRTLLTIPGVLSPPLLTSLASRRSFLPTSLEGTSVVPVFRHGKQVRVSTFAVDVGTFDAKSDPPSYSCVDVRGSRSVLPVRTSDFRYSVKSLHKVAKNRHDRR